jgi:hypothetical protein
LSVDGIHNVCRLPHLQVCFPVVRSRYLAPLE